MLFANNPGMGYSEERSKKWRELHHQAIQQWQETLKTRLNWGGYFNDERLEMEVLQLLEDRELKEIWLFSCGYVLRRKTAKLRSMFMKCKNEIERFGTIEPLWRQELIATIKKEKMRKRKQ